MSAMQKLLKITSIIMLVLGGLFIPLTVMNFIHAETFPGIIIAVLTAPDGALRYPAGLFGVDRGQRAQPRDRPFAHNRHGSDR